MPEATCPSSCERRWGQCMRDMRCPDHACPGHPSQRCSSCNQGRCVTPQACNQPDASAPPVRITPRMRGRVLALIPAACGLLLFAVEAVRYFHHH